MKKLFLILLLISMGMALRIVSPGKQPEKPAAELKYYYCGGSDGIHLASAIVNLVSATVHLLAQTPLDLFRSKPDEQSTAAQQKTKSGAEKTAQSTAADEKHSSPESR